MGAGGDAWLTGGWQGKKLFRLVSKDSCGGVSRSIGWRVYDNSDPMLGTSISSSNLHQKKEKVESMSSVYNYFLGPGTD